MFIEHITDLLPAIEGHGEFVVTDKGDYSVINYVYTQEDSFDDPRRLECRGIKFDASGRLIARPFHKFFNVGERPETQVSELDWDGHMVMEKLDGSMIHPAIVNGDLYYMTRMGVTDISEQAHFFAFDHTARGGPKYAKFCESLIGLGFTPIFEWTSPANRIVIKYAEPQLTLIAIRKMDTGDYTPYEVMLNECKLWGIPCVSDIRIGLVPTDLIAAIKSWENREGIVVRFPGGKMVKIKADAYVLRHRAKEAIEREKNVLHLVLEGAVDDLVAMLDDDAEKLLAYASDVRERVSESAKHIDYLIATAKYNGHDRKKYAIQWAATLPAILKAPAFQAWDGKDTVSAITEMMKKKCGSQTHVDMLAPILKDTRWMY